MNPQTVALMAMAEAAFQAALSLPPFKRADVYEGIAIALNGHAPDISVSADSAAEAIRVAEGHQLLLTKLFENNNEPSLGAGELANNFLAQNL